MKKFVKISLALTLSIIFCISGCSNNKDEAESSVENVSVVSTVFSTYEKNTLREAVETPLEIACTTLYECVCTGSVNQKTVDGRSFSFAKKLPLNNASPTDKKNIANKLTIADAIEYFELQEVYSDDNIREYGYMTASYSDVDIIKGTVVKIEIIKKICEDYKIFDSTQTKLGDFINANLLLSK
ncbi:MAG: hypothetical protein IIT39_00410 [Clostridia bacterium]|nr:hypothetical protein [Clostridia bacterium]